MTSARDFTLGVEEELQVVAPGDLCLASRAASLIERAGAAGVIGAKAELHQAMIELATPVCRDVGELASVLRRNRAALVRAARAEGLAILAAGTHPVSDWRDQRITESPYYEGLIEELQDVGRANVIFGLHVHVAVHDPETRIAVFNAARHHLPVFLALSASSPFLSGRRTGLRSSRILTWQRLPGTGVPGRFADHAAFRELLDTLVRSGGLDPRSAAWWDLRPHPNLPTVELRICDMPTRPDDAVALAGLFQALVAYLARRVEAGHEPPSPRREVIVQNKFRAARHGLDSSWMVPGGERPVPARRVVGDLLDTLAEAADDLGARGCLDRVRGILREGTSADRQLAAWERADGDMAAVLAFLERETVAGLYDRPA